MDIWSKNTNVGKIWIFIVNLYLQKIKYYNIYIFINSLLICITSSNKYCGYQEIKKTYIIYYFLLKLNNIIKLAYFLIR